MAMREIGFDSMRVLDGLSEVQREAASYMNGPLIIVAGPGSGKTRVMSHRMAYIIANGVPPWRALGVTFTNKAAGELAGRCESLVSRFVPGAERPQVRTFHSWGARFLRRNCEMVGLRPEFSIYDRDDQTQLMKRIVVDSESDLSVNALINEISKAKNDNVNADQYASLSTDHRHEMAAEAYALYQSALEAGNAVDFDDLLMLPHKALSDNADLREYWQNRYLHLMVDEFQDTNTLQFELVRTLGGLHRNVCIVGDPDQSIYSWRNARPENMNAFRAAFDRARVFELNESYRSTKKIIAAADSVIAHNARNFERTLFTRNEAGTDIRVVSAFSVEHEAGLVLDRFRELKRADRNIDAAILYRTNAQSRVIETECNQRGIPYRLIGGTRFYDRREVKDALAFLKIVTNPTDEVSLRRIVNVPPRGIGAVTLNKLEQYALNNHMTLLGATLATLDPVAAQGLGIRGKSLSNVAGFATFVSKMITNSETLEPADLLRFALSASGYNQSLSKDPSTAQDRRQNLDELLSVANQYSSISLQSGVRQALTEFLEHTALFANIDQLGPGEEDSETAISLITLHQTKGLEFDAVFIVGASEGLLPHLMAMEGQTIGSGESSGVMEERRLMYVGMTRAKRELQISYAAISSWGAPTPRSRFIDEIDPEIVSEADDDLLVRQPRGESLGRAGPRSADGGFRSRPTDTRERRDRGLASVGVGDLDRSARSVPQEWEFAAGERVNHATFGRGVVINSRHAGGDVVVNVAFMSREAGVKRLMASMAKLERVE